jgi:queuine/archaeosine tRNA-ribosyltransferase
MFRSFKPTRSARARRVCEKDGTANVKYKNISEKRRRYLRDIFTTLVDSS